MSVSLTKFNICPNLDCRKKLNPYPAQIKVSCNNCKRKMLLKKCPSTFTCQVTLACEDKTQSMYAIFPNVLAELFDTGVEDLDLLEDQLLSLENVDFHVNKKKVVMKIIPHNKMDKEQ
eukprot:gene17146-18871_t